MPDLGLIQALFSLLVLISGSLVVVATIRRTWTAQTIAELKALADAQQQRIDELEAHLERLQAQVAAVKARIGAPS